MSNEETKEVKKELDEIEKKFDEARGVKFKVNYRVVRFNDHGDLSSKNSLTMQICPMKKLLQMMKQVMMIQLPLLKLRSMRISLLGYRFLSNICCLYCPVLYITDRKNEEVDENYDSVDNDKVGGFEK